ncbi:helix-turn-helix domain-containing protein [Kitasatospora sp. NPDC048239]|uniref:helix-turn-helix domain-containing protein n=1 Tax=Kitasatospora sp. NPDC048239 TaxID=3364046 RepID=UPI00371ABA14
MVESTVEEGAEGGAAVAEGPGAAGAAAGGRVGERQVGERQVGDVETLKALADPLRLSILRALMEAAGEGLTAKEIAAFLGESQTKLYRHLKQLEKAGLIVVAGTRLVSGIVESRYAAAQESVRLSPELFATGSPTRTEAYGAVLAAVDRVRDDFHAQARSGRLDFSAPKDGSAGPPSLFSHIVLRVEPARLVRLRAQLAAVIDEFMADGNSDADGSVDITLLGLLYGVPSDPAALGSGAPSEPVARGSGAPSGSAPGTES